MKLSLIPLALLGAPVYAAGRVRNNTPWTMHYTTHPNTNVPGRCHFRNWYTDSNPIPRDQTVNCTQTPLGGNGQNSRGDADGFTFSSRDYWIGPIKITKGVWIKISNVHTVVCEDVLGQAICAGVIL